MRILTIAMLGLLIWITSGLTNRVFARQNSEPFSELTEFTDDPVSDSFVEPRFRSHPLTSIPLDQIEPEVFESLDIQELMMPAEPETPSFPVPERRGELFSEPFYPAESTVEQRQRVLRVGASGSEVGALQKRLKDHGFNPGTIDSLFGSRTQTAVRQFQRTVGLVATGEVDQKTWEALATFRQQLVVEVPVLKSGSTGSKVKTLQIRLQTQGFNPGPVDGILGTRTTAAVKEFQLTLGLNGDGVVDEQTWTLLSQITPAPY